MPCRFVNGTDRGQGARGQAAADDEAWSESKSECERERDGGDVDGDDVDDDDGDDGGDDDDDDDDDATGGPKYEKEKAAQADGGKIDKKCMGYSTYKTGAKRRSSSITTLFCSLPAWSYCFIA